MSLQRAPLHDNYFMLDFDQQKDWTIRPVLERSKRCVDGVAPVDFPKGTQEHETLTKRRIATNIKFYVCPLEGVQIHKNLVTDEFGKYAIFKSTFAEKDTPTLPAMKVVLGNYLTEENNNPSQDYTVPIKVPHPTKYIPQMVYIPEPVDVRDYSFDKE